MSRYLVNISLLSLLIVGCSQHKEAVSLKLPSEENIPEIDTSPEIASAIMNGDWKKAIFHSQKSRDPLKQLIYHRGLYEIEDYETLLERPDISDELYEDYDVALKILAARKIENWEKVTERSTPQDLSDALREKLVFAKGEAYRELGNYRKARLTFNYFLETFRKSEFRIDALFNLADVEWDSDNKREALKVYERIYRYYPLGDQEDVAKEKLVTAGTFQEIDTNVHISRIERLQKGAHFKRARRELKALRKIATEEEHKRIDLAIGHLTLAERKYRSAEKLARSHIKEETDVKVKTEWQLIHALAITRQGKLEEGAKEYESLLNAKLRKPVREKMLLRLGLIAMDDLKYDDAAEWFAQLRKEFDRGRYQESSHWFGAWSLYQTQKGKEKADLDSKKLSQAIQLLKKLPHLPEGKHLEPQAVYWSAEIAKTIGKNELADKLTTDLKNRLAFSMHRLLLDPKPFHFVYEREIRQDALKKPKVLFTTQLKRKFEDRVSWRRLEAFRKLAVKDWAGMELNRFLHDMRNESERLKLLVAHRLEEVEDWSDLISWSLRHFDKSIDQFDPGSVKARYHYPLAYSSYVLKSAEEFGVSPFLIWGIMREESRFDPQVVSWAGAVGLMQLMPSLSNKIGRRLNDPPGRRKRITNPARNIRYGTYHLAELRKQIRKLEVPVALKPVLMVAAYNAGFSAVKRWIKEEDTSTVGGFIESIPYSETRLYVKRVMRSAHIYYKLYGEAAEGVAEKTSEIKL